ncbi:hypothetical protein ACN3XK_15125 [Actinomadura welshii]
MIDTSPNEEDNTEGNPDPYGNQAASGNQIGHNLFQLSRVRNVNMTVTSTSEAAEPAAPGGRHLLTFLGSRVFLGGVATLAVVVTTISGAFYVRGQLQSGESGNQGKAPAVSGAGALSAGATTRPPVTESVIDVDTNTNPLAMGSVDLQEIYGRNQDWLIPRPQVVEGEPEGGNERPAENFYRFVKERKGVAVNRLFFGATVQNLTGGAVYLRSMRVTALKCSGPLSGTRVWSGGGADPLTPRAILINLDAPGPVPLYFSKIPEHWLSPPGNSQINKKKAKTFGFTLPGGGTESYDFVALSYKHRSCSFKLAIAAVVNGQSEEIIIDDDGGPFRVTGDPDHDLWMYDLASLEHKWRRVSQLEAGNDDPFPEPGQPLQPTDP